VNETLTALNSFIENLPKWVVSLLGVAVGMVTATGLELIKERRAAFQLERALCKEVASIYFHITGTMKVFDPKQAPDPKSQVTGTEDLHVVVIRGDLQKRIHQTAYRYAESNPALYYRLTHHDQVLAVYYALQYIFDTSRPFTADAYFSVMRGVKDAIERALRHKTFSKRSVRSINDPGIRQLFLNLRDESRPSQ